MSWRWIVDTRGDRVTVDWPKLAVAAGLGLVLAVIHFRVLPSPWQYVLVIPLAVGAIYLDIRLRRSG